jgi:Kef-type K+ transport system membrane component KefB/nucleotide-binding universal stress UspA family protein
MTGEVIEPLGHHELLLVFVQLFLLLVTARILGELAMRIDFPAVIGELLAGILLGPSLLGAVAPGVFSAVFPTDPAQFHLLEVISWLGLTMLLILTGLETDVRLIAREARAAALVSLTGIAVPFAFGFGIALVLPQTFLAGSGDRLVFSLFVATALSISALPVIAKVLMDMDVIRRDISQLTLAAGMINDTLGWILLAVVAGLARSGVLDFGVVAETVVALLAVLGLAFTVGQRAAARLVRFVDTAVGGEAAKLSVLMALAFGVGAVTHALGLEAVLGAFLVGVLFSRIKRFDRATEHTFEVVTLGVFAPIFFGIAGLRVDLTAMLDPVVAIAGAAVLAVAVAGKFVGSYVGARLAGLSTWEGVTMGAGLNARGAMEIIVATIGLGVGVLTVEMYSLIVMVALVTSIMAPPLLRWAFDHVEVSDSERERLEREQRQAHSFVENIHRILLPTRCSVDTQYAAQLLRYLIRDREIEVTNMYVGDDEYRRSTSTLARLRYRVRTRLTSDGNETIADGGLSAKTATDTTVDEDANRCLDLIRFHENPPRDRRVRDIVHPIEGGVTGTVLSEAERGYDLLVIGTADRPRGTAAEPLFSTDIDHIIQEASCPIMVVTAGSDGESQMTVRDDPELDRILLPTVGTEYNRHAAEIAFTIARNRNALVEIVHIVERSDELTAANDDGTIEIGEKIVDREADLGRELGAQVRTRVLVSDRAPETEILSLAAENDDDLIILGSNLRPLSGRAFFGHRVEHVVQHADRPVAVLVSA